MHVLAREMIPEGYFDDCTDDTRPCHGIPSCVSHDALYYQKTTSSEFTIRIIDINNNPPRFFNFGTKRFIDGLENASLECLQSQICSKLGSGMIEEKPASDSVLQVIVNNGQTSERVVVYDMDIDDQNTKFTLVIKQINYFKDGEEKTLNIDTNFILEVADEIIKEQRTRSNYAFWIITYFEILVFT